MIVKFLGLDSYSDVINAFTKAQFFFFFSLKSTSVLDLSQPQNIKTSRGKLGPQVHAWTSFQ